jgi:8-oxo-dGTP diphosphatase
MLMSVPCGVAVFIVRHTSLTTWNISHEQITYCSDLKILLGLRCGAHGAGTWAPPGGRVEPGEQPVDTANREVYEETGLTIASSMFSLLPYNSTLIDGVHPWVTLFFIAMITNQIARVMEPDKCIALDWFSWKDFPQPLFTPLKEAIKVIGDRYR